MCMGLFFSILKDKSLEFLAMKSKAMTITLSKLPTSIEFRVEHSKKERFLNMKFHTVHRRELFLSLVLKDQGYRQRSYRIRQQRQHFNLNILVETLK